MWAAMLPQRRGTGQRQVGVALHLLRERARKRGRRHHRRPRGMRRRRWRYWFLPRIDAGWPGNLSDLPVLMTRMPFLVSSTLRIETSLSM
jgi:hypothetical protein